MSDATSPDAPRPRRARTALVVAAPLVLAAAYAAVYRFVGDRPSLDAMVPDDAVLVWRFRDAAAYDAFRTPPEEAGTRYASASRALGAEVNLPELAGVDRGRPLLEVRLDPARRVDPRYWVLPVADASTLRATSRDPDLPERHARRVDVHGDWAAASSDFDAAKRAGHGSRSLPPARGEAWMVTAPDWPAFVDAMLRPSEAGEPPTSDVLAALGFDPKAATRRETPEGVEYDVPGGRVAVVRSGWSRVTVYGFEDRVRAELVPAAPDLVAALAAASTPGDDAAVLAPSEADLAVAGGPARRAVALALGYAGVPWPAAAAKDDFAALRLDAPDPLEAWAEMIPGTFPGWVVVLLGKAGSLPETSSFGFPAVAPGQTAPLHEAPAITMPYGPVVAPAEIARRAVPDDPAGREVVALGSGAASVADRLVGDAAALEPHRGLREAGAPTVLARFRLSASAAVRLLGRALGRGGILSPLHGAEIVGTLSTDGRSLVLDARAASGR